MALDIMVRDGRVLYSGLTVAELHAACEPMRAHTPFRTTFEEHVAFHITWMQADIKESIRTERGPACDMCEKFAGMSIAIREGWPVLTCSPECDAAAARGDITPWLLRAPERERAAAEHLAKKQAEYGERHRRFEAEQERRRVEADNRAGDAVVARYREWAQARRP